MEMTSEDLKTLLQGYIRKPRNIISTTNNIPFGICAEKHSKTLGKINERDNRTNGDASLEHCYMLLNKILFQKTLGRQPTCNGLLNVSNVEMARWPDAYVAKSQPRTGNAWWPGAIAAMRDT
ncbi:hypothetical protein KIN20_009556 [Parelaphostrongylus tenuis]|uniref:Uncharacterized protein n=1 Tax=Parelaphostrongylus tenuis TaxID=148309 RepID=A0AAD5MP74_PARTN|nr:hypothetical protein KIN20_009556 [Parelaphostrongylus tenuis]